MKAGKIFLVLGLALVLAAGTDVSAACSSWDDCGDYWPGYIQFCYNNLDCYNSTGNFYDCVAGTCRVAPPKYPYAHAINANCSEGNPEACQNGNLYSIRWICGFGGCRVDASRPLKAANSPKCDPADPCTGDAHRLGASVHSINYDADFIGERVFDSDSGNYVLAPGSKLYVDDIGWIKYACGNGVEVSRTANLFVWVYNASNNQRLARGQNNIDIDSSLNREDLIGPGSLKRGAPIVNAFEMVLDYEMENTEISDIYTFNKPSKYNVFIDIISGYCAPNDAIGWPLTQNYVCPSGISRPGVDLCKWEGREVDGWTALENLKVLVPGPEITLDAPTDEPNLTSANIQKTWTIENTGIGKTIMNITYDCGNWTCAFVSAPVTRVPLSEGGSFPVTLDITADLSETAGHLVGIIVTYDEGYGLNAIKSKTKNSYITLGGTTPVTTTSLGASTTIPNIIT